MVGDEVKLLEVTQDVAECFKVGDTLTIRGDDTENAVICSKEKTFEIKEAETSNSLMLVDRVTLPDKVDKSSSDRRIGWSSVGGVFHKYIEIIEIRPKLRKLRDVLSRNLYTEDSRRENMKGIQSMPCPCFIYPRCLMSPGMTISELLDTVQASEEELRQGLRHYDCVEVEDMWYILDQDYQMMVLSRILKWVC